MASILAFTLDLLPELLTSKLLGQILFSSYTAFKVVKQLQPWTDCSLQNLSLVMIYT